MSLRFHTLLVSKLLRSNEVSWAQLKNIPVMLVTLLVSKFERSSEVRKGQL